MPRKKPPTKQQLWQWLKAENHFNNKQRRGVAVTMVTPRKPVRCICIHTLKHHKKSGHCRPGCACKAGDNKVSR